MERWCITTLVSHVHLSILATLKIHPISLNWKSILIESRFNLYSISIHTNDKMVGICILHLQNFEIKGYSKKIRLAFKIITGEFTNKHIRHT